MDTQTQHAVESPSDHSEHGSYKALAVEMVIDFAIMYFVMYTMIASLDHFRFNVNNLYMTLMMVAPMSIVMLVGMRRMFRSRRLNIAIISGAALLFVTSFIGMRTQAGVGDKEFLRSMIPHHSGAILMCEQASIRDPEITKLCHEIVKSQRAEIAQMQAMLKRL